MKPKITKEELVELIGMADLLEAKLNDLGLPFYVLTGRHLPAKTVTTALRERLNAICGEEYLETLRNPEKSK